jgi:hypothetical protein
MTSLIIDVWMQLPTRRRLVSIASRTFRLAIDIRSECARRALLRGQHTKRSGCARERRVRPSRDGLGGASHGRVAQAAGFHLCSSGWPRVQAATKERSASRIAADRADRLAYPGSGFIGRF